MEVDVTFSGTADPESAEAVVRPLLAALHDLTGLSSTYLTRIDLDAGVQHIDYALNRGDVRIPEGLAVDWDDTLCRRALDSGVLRTDDVPGRWGDSEAAQTLGIQTYATAPVTRPDGALVGTLCGVSADRLPVGEDVARTLAVFSRVIGDALIREEQRRLAFRRADAAEERLRARAEFLAVAEHKLKTPLAIVTGWARTLQREGLPPEVTAQGLEIILATSGRLATDVDDLLREATSEVVTANLELAPTDLRLLVAGIVRDWAGTSAAHPVALAPGDPVRATVDVRAVRIILEHVIENAIKYSPDGGSIDVVVSRREGRAVVSVRDRGQGLPDGVDVFAPFERGAADRPGAGLGLHIVRSLAVAMGGAATAAPADGGTCVEVALPLG